MEPIINPAKLSEKEKQDIKEKYSNALSFAMNHNPPEAWRAKSIVEEFEYLFGKEFFKDIRI